MADGYIEPPVVTDAEDLAARIYDYIEANYPGWEANPANLETIMSEAYASVAADVQDVARAQLDEQFRSFGTTVAGVAADEDVAATVASTWTMIDDTGYTIPAGTQVGIPGPTGLVLFLTTEDVVVPQGNLATIDGEVTLEADEPGSDANGLSGAPVLIDTLTYVASVALVGTTAEGVTGETRDEYLDRLAREYRLMSPRPILPDDFAALLVNRVDGVARALAIDLLKPAFNELQSVIATGGSAGTFTLTYDGQTTAAIAYNAAASAVQSALEALSNIGVGDVSVTGGPLPETAVVVEFTGALAGTDVPVMTVTDSITGGNAVVTVTREGSAEDTAAERTVAVAAHDEDGAALDAGTKATGEATLEAMREANFNVYVIDPSFNAVEVAATVRRLDGFTDAEVEANAEAALVAYLDPATWGQPLTGDIESVGWIDEDTVRLFEVAEMLNRADGVHYVSALTINGAAADFAMTGHAPLPYIADAATDIVVTVTAP